MENIELWHERDISHSSVERVILPDSSIIAHYAVTKFTAVVRALDIRPDRMQENLKASRGLAFSGTVLTKLVESGMTRDEAYDRVQAAAMEARRTGASFRDATLADDVVTERLGREEAEEAFSMSRHLAHVDEVFERIGLNDDRAGCGCESD
jgi:adenylosuccinate lyase